MSHALTRGAFVLALALAGCGVQVSPAPRSQPGQAWGPQLIAGVAREDITPPPGLSLFGHGPEGRVAAGTLLRLQCTAFFLARNDEAVALVPCDLGAPSIELQRAVAARVAARDRRIGADRILLMATHTHASAAHYFGARQYGGTFSSRTPGFDPRVLDFLAERIASAILIARASAQPARVDWSIAPCAGGGLVKNRSMAALVSNPVLPRSLMDQIIGGCGRFRPQLGAGSGQATAPGPGGEPTHLSPAELAADLRLSVLRVHRLVGRGEGAPAEEPIGAFAVFGVHNTAIPNDNDLYHSDLFGYAVREAESRLQAHLGGGGAEPGAARVLVAVANGIEGDVSPAASDPSVAEARRLGQALGQRIAGAFLAPEITLPDDGTLTRAYRELYLPGALAAPPSPNAPEARLCPSPEIGAAAAGGSEDGSTWLRIFPQMREGSLAAEPDACQGRKLVLRGPEGPFSDDGLDFPNIAPVALVRVGGALIASVPFEMTTVVGYTLRDQLSSLVPSHGDPTHGVVMIGLTNSYLQYVATASEYAMQHYEGASTLYGPETARFLGNQLLCLGSLLFGRSAPAECDLRQPHAVNEVKPVAFDPGVVSRMPDGGEPAQYFQARRLEVKRSPRALWPSWTVRFPGAPIGAAQPRERVVVRIVDDSTGALLDDDSGTGMEVRFAGQGGGERGWFARWTPRWTKGNPHCGKSVHFKIASGGYLRSGAFQVVCEDSVTELIECGAGPSALPGSPPVGSATMDPAVNQ